MARALRLMFFALVLAAPPPALAQSLDSTKIGAINVSYVAQNCRAGKAALAALDAFGRQKSIEIDAKAADLQKQQAVLQNDAASMSPRAVADLQRAFEKARLEFDRFRQDAQAEIEAMQTKFDADFRIRLAPIVDAVSKEKGLHLVFGIEQAPIIWWSPSVDISDEVVKRLDAEK